MSLSKSSLNLPQRPRRLHPIELVLMLVPLVSGAVYGVLWLMGLA